MVAPSDTRRGSDLPSYVDPTVMKAIHDNPRCLE